MKILENLIWHQNSSEETPHFKIPKKKQNKNKKQTKNNNKKKKN